MAAPRVAAAVTRPLHNFTILNATSAQVDAKLQGMKAMEGPCMTRNACPEPAGYRDNPPPQTELGILRWISL